MAERGCYEVGKKKVHSGKAVLRAKCYGHEKIPVTVQSAREQDQKAGVDREQVSARSTTESAVGKVGSHLSEPDDHERIE